MSFTGNPPDIETRERIVQLPDHPGVEYSVTLVRPIGHGVQAWMLAEVTVRSTGNPITTEDFPAVEQLVQAALYEHPARMTQTPADSTQDLDWLPDRYRRALYLRGVLTTEEVLALSDQQLLDIDGIGKHGVEAIKAAFQRLVS
ncbi:hypothetical protein [Nocardia sp. NPDC127526]|uniref:hypothetical protein n=1 Tax=Nocardia sp. NPDC127526 TaxID=3345393 RepID=UPI00363DF5C5